MPFIAAPARLMRRLPASFPQRLQTETDRLILRGCSMRRSRLSLARSCSCTGIRGDFGQFWSTVGTLCERSFHFTPDLIPIPDVPGLDPEMHVALSDPVNVHRTDGSVALTPNAGWLSGSAIWDTKYVAAGTNEWEYDRQRYFVSTNLPSATSTPTEGV